MIYQLKQSIKKYWFYYSAGLFLLFALKLFYSRADAAQLRFILAPVSSLISALAGIPFFWESHAGYVNHDLRFIIAPSCSGMQFMMITFATLFFSFLHRIQNKGFCWFAASLLFSYLYTIPVNTFRILLAIFLPSLLGQAGILHHIISPETLHTLIGTVVYFAALLLLYSLAGRFIPAIEYNSDTKEAKTSGKLFSKVFPPVFWYFTLVLGVPFLTRSLRNNFQGFQEYALLITVICLAEIIVFSALFQNILHKRAQ